MIIAIAVTSALRPEFVEITTELDVELRGFEVKSIATNSNSSNQFVMLYNDQAAKLFQFNQDNNAFVDITGTSGIKSLDLVNIQTIIFLTNQLLAICYSSWDRLAKIYLINEDNKFIEISTTCGIEDSDLKNVQRMICIDNPHRYLVFICYYPITSKGSKLFNFDQETSLFESISDLPGVDLSDLIDAADINYGNSQLIFAYQDKPAQIFQFNKEYNECANITSTCGIKCEDLKEVRATIFSNNQLILIYYRPHHHYKRNNRGMLIHNKYAKFYQVSDCDKFTYILDETLFDDQVLEGITCIQFIKSALGTIALVSDINCKLRIFHDPKMVFYEKKPHIKSARSSLNV